MRLIGRVLLLKAGHASVKFQHKIYCLMFAAASRFQQNKIRSFVSVSWLPLQKLEIWRSTSIKIEAAIFFVTNDLLKIYSCSLILFILL